MARAGRIHLQSLPTLALVTAALSNLINNSAAVMLLMKMTDMSHPADGLRAGAGQRLRREPRRTRQRIQYHRGAEAREMGIAISFRDFARLGVPVTAAALAGLLTWVLLIT